MRDLGRGEVIVLVLGASQNGAESPPPRHNQAIRATREPTVVTAGNRRWRGTGTDLLSAFSFLRIFKPCFDPRSGSLRI